MTTKSKPKTNRTAAPRVIGIDRRCGKPKSDRAVYWDATVRRLERRYGKGCT